VEFCYEKISIEMCMFLTGFLQNIGLTSLGSVSMLIMLPKSKTTKKNRMGHSSYPPAQKSHDTEKNKHNIYHDNQR
jgi:hypothetical protein